MGAKRSRGLLMLVLFDDAKSTLFIKSLMNASGFDSLNGLMPFRVVGHLVIEEGWVPFNVQSHHNMRWVFEFVVS